MEDNIIPNTLKVDDDVNDLHFRNKNMNNLSNINNLDDFVCVFENVGIEYPKLAMGLKYKLAKTKAEKKEICESNKRQLINGNLIGEGLLFLKKDDWINPETSEYECGVFDLDGNRQKYGFNSRKFPSSKLCDKYYDINNGANFYTRMVPKKLDSPFIDLREPEFDKELQYKTVKKIFYITLITILFFTFYFLYNYELKRPYEFYDNMKNIIFNKAILLLIAFSIYVFIFCPFNMCYLSNESSLFRRDINKFMRINFCNFTKDNINNVGVNLSSMYDNNNFIKNFDIIISFLVDINTYIERPMKYLNNKLCNKCDVKNPCILRNSYYKIKIIKPEIINYFSNNINILEEINDKFMYNEDKELYNSGTIIYLKSDKKDLNNKVFMCCLTLSNNNYNYNWIKLKDRNGDMEYKNENDINSIRIKMCKDSYRILSVDNNYDLIGYNIQLSVANYISIFEKNYRDYTEYPFYPNFTMNDLTKNNNYNKKKNFIKRKIVRIFKYHTSNPSFKFKTQNVSIYKNNLYRYDYKNSLTFKLPNHYKTYIDYSLNLSLKLNEINDFHNDDEEDNDYLSFYNPRHELINKDFYLNSSYNLDMKEINKNINLDDDINNLMYKLNLEFTNLNYIQRGLIRERITNKILDNYNNIKIIKLSSNSSENLLSKKLKEGTTLIADTSGIFDNNVKLVFQWQERENGVSFKDISDSIKNIFTINKSYIGKYIRLNVKLENGNTSFNSSSYLIVEDNQESIDSNISDFSEIDNYIFQNKNRIINDDQKEIKIKNIMYKENYIMQEFKKDHCYDSINYLQDGVVNQCIFCKQTCK